MIFESKFPIRTFHCDSFGHVNNARYMELLEEARWQFGEEIGLTPLLRQSELGFIIMDMQMKFRSPVFEGDHAMIQTSLVTLGSSSGEVRQTLFANDSTRPALKSTFHFILIDRNNENRSVAIEGNIRECLLKIVHPD